MEVCVLQSVEKRASSLGWVKEEIVLKRWKFDLFFYYGWPLIYTSWCHLLMCFLRVVRSATFCHFSHYLDVYDPLSIPFSLSTISSYISCFTFLSHVASLFCLLKTYGNLSLHDSFLILQMKALLRIGSPDFIPFNLSNETCIYFIVYIYISIYGYSALN